MTSSYASPNKRRKIDYGSKFEKDWGPTDCTIVCGDVEFVVHKVVLAGKSEYLDMRINQEHRVTTESRLVISEENIRYVQAVLYWIYTEDYDDDRANDPTFDGPLLFNVKLHGLADRWEIPKLQELASQRLVGCLDNGHAEEDFFDAVAQVYDLGSKKDQVLGDSLAQEVATYSKTFEDQETLRNTFRKHGAFAANVMEHVLARFPTYRCGGCKREVEMQAFAKKEEATLRCVFCLKGKLEIVEDDGDGGNDP